MSESKNKLGIFIIANAVVWGAVIIGSALILKNTGLMPKMMPLLGGGSAFSVIFLPMLLTGKKK